MTSREEIKSACEYCPFEKCDYTSYVSIQKIMQVLIDAGDSNDIA